MTKTLILSFLVALGAGCGGGGPAEEAVSGVRSFKDKICKCDTEACVDKVGEEYEAWRKEMKKKVKEADFSEAQGEAIDKAEEEMEQCVVAKGFD